MTDVVIVDYGLGNLFNLERALESLGATCSFASTPEKILGAQHVILPGVGAFEAGIHNLREKKLVQPVIDHAQSGKPLLGICLGMQLMLSESFENGTWQGLDLVKGKVRKLKPEEQDCKVPNIGWNKLAVTSSPKPAAIFDGIPEGSEMYFVHSYCADLSDKAAIAASTAYGKDTFCSAIAQGNIFGCQFHPERSAAFGLKILENFIKL